MPVPSLPLELVQHICDYLEVLYPLDRTGINIALTCRAWRRIGYRLSVRRMSFSFSSGIIYRPSVDLASRKARHFLETPVLLSFVEDLDLDTRHFYNSNLEEYSEEEFVRRILAHTSSLRRLGLTPSAHGGQEVLHALSTAPLPACLHTLHVNCRGFRPTDIRAVLNALARLPRLDSLTLEPTKRGAAWVDPQAATATVDDRRLRLSHLEIDCSAYYDSCAFIRFILSNVLNRIRPEHVRSLNLICTDEDFTTHVEAISSCSRLRRLRIALSLLPFDEDTHFETSGFAELLTVIRHLDDLQELSIEQPPWGMDDRPSSPLPLATFLALFRPSIRRLDFSCCQFEADWQSIPLYTEQEHGCLIVRRLAKIRLARWWDRYGDEAADYVELESSDGLLCWRRMHQSAKSPLLSQLPPSTSHQ